MLKWLIRKTIPHLQDWIESKEGQEYIHEVLDAEIDRQIARIRSSAGGVMHGQGGAGENTLIGNIIQAILPGIAQKFLNSSSPSVLPEKNPFA